MFSFLGGCLHLALAFAMGMQVGSLLAIYLVLTIAAFAANAVVSFALPANQLWLHPLMFSLPSLLIGLLAFASGSGPFFVSIGLGTFLVGLVASHLVQTHKRNRSSV